MVVVGETEIDAPLPSGVPPQEPEYHCQLAPEVSVPDTVSVDELPEQIVSGAEIAEVGAAGS